MSIFNTGNGVDPGEALSLRQCAKALHVDPGQLAKESKLPGFPAADKAGRRKLEEVRAWRYKNVRQRKPSRPVPARPAVSGQRPQGKPDQFTDTLLSGQASALEVSRAAMQLASKKLGSASLSDNVGGRDFDDLAKALQELRQAEAGYIELEEKRGQLIARDKVKQLVGGCCTRLIQCLDNVIAGISTEVDVWTADPAFAALPADDRHRKVRTYVDRVCREVRQQEADGVSALIRKQTRDEKAGES